MTPLGRFFQVLTCCLVAATAWGRDNPRLAAVDYQATTYTQPAVRARLAEFDLVVLGFWRGYGSSRVNDLVKDLRSRHPGIRLGQYTVLNEVAGLRGASDANSDLVDKLDREDWWLHDASGRKAQWTSVYNAHDVNLTAWVKPDAQGQRWPQWKAHRDATQLLSQWTSPDFVFLDNVFEAPRERAIWHPGGNESAPNDPDVAAAMRRGYVSYVQSLRQEAPGVSIVGNVDHDLMAPEYDHVFDGAFLEGLIGRNWSIESTRGWPALMARYRHVAQEVRNPRMVVFHVSGAGNDYRLMRYGLTSCLMGDGLFAYSADGAAMPAWFDEFDVDLGAATGPAEQLPAGVWVRHFARGIAMVNPGPVPADVALPSGYKHLQGHQAPDINNGEPVRDVKIDARDGVVLIRSTP